MPPLRSEAQPRSPEAFAPFLATKVPVLLVGGQAVNVWALYYEKRTRDLAPFVSRDVDVLGDRETLQALGRLAGTKPQIFPLRPPTNEVGVVIAKDRDGQPLLIEVLRHVHGITNEELCKPAYTVALGDTPIRVPGPVALLQAKIANVADLAQSGRQDGRHVIILTQLMSAYLKDLQKAATTGRLEERALIEHLENLLALATSKKGKKILGQLRINARNLFDGLGNKKLTKLTAFLGKRLPRAL